MLQLHVTDFDIGRISNILTKHRLKSTITNSTIIIYTDEIPSKVVDMLFANATIVGAQNYQLKDSDTSDYVETKSENDNESTITSAVEESGSNHASENVKDDTFVDIPQESNGKNYEGSTETKYHQIPKTVYRGEVYKWGSIRDDPDGEGKIKECVIIIQNDYQNSASDDTIALFCTSHYEERTQISLPFRLTHANMIDYRKNRFKSFDNCTFFVSRIRGISRKDLGEYMGTMNDIFMDTIQPTIDFCLGLKRSRDVNWDQLKILSTVNIEDLFKISESNVNNKRKVENFLELFGFDMSSNGVEYVKEAILTANKLSYYSLEYLAETIAKRKNADANEVLRLIVVRIKDNFNFKKSPAIAFIRLVDGLIKKGWTMNLTILVTKKESTSMSNLIKQMCTLNSRITVDSVNGKISIVDMDDDNVGGVIDAINEAFDIIAVDITPTIVISEPESAVPEASIEFEKIEFNNEEVREQMNKLLRVIYWSMYHKNAKPRDIGLYLMTAGAEISMKYNPKEPIKVSIGDVVDCNYGSHLKGEISGGHVHSIVCNIDNDGMVYVLPITKTKLGDDETRYLPFSANLDVEYTNARYTGGTVLLKMGRYVHPQRFNEVVGHVFPEFFLKVLTALSTTVNFSSIEATSDEETSEIHVESSFDEETSESLPEATSDEEIS